MTTLRYAGFGNETTYGTAVSAAFHVDIQSSSLDAPSGTEMYYPGGIGRGLRTRRPGWYRPEGDVVYGWDIRTITHLLRWTLGEYVWTSGAPGNNLHEIWPTASATLPSFTTRIGKDLFEHVFAGCVADSLELDLASDFLLATMGVSASKDAKASITSEDNLLLPSEFPLAFHEVTLSLPDASDVSANVRALKLSIANGLLAESGRGIGSRYPYRMDAGARDVTLTADFYYESTDHLEAMWGDANGPSDSGATDYALTITADAGADGQLVLHAPSAHFTKVSTTGSGRDEIVLSTEIRLMTGTLTLDDASTASGELLASVTNSLGDLED